MVGFHRMPIGDVMRLRQRDVDGYALFKSAAQFYAETISNETLESTYAVCVGCTTNDCGDDLANVVDICARDRMCYLIIFDVSSTTAYTNRARAGVIMDRVENDPLLSDWVFLNTKSDSIIALYRS